MATLVYDDNLHTLTLYSAAGTQLGQWTAYNNAASSSSGKFPAASFTFSWHSPHAGGTANTAFGSNGNFVFAVPGRTGMGVHSGRSATPDGAGRTGPRHATQGCIRTTDQATAQILLTHTSDALTKLTVKN